MATIDFGKSVSLAQAAQLIVSNPRMRFLLQGEPGIGKSSLLATLKERLPGHHMSYIDVPNLDLGDIAMPAMDHEAKVTRYYPNSRFMMHTGAPVAIMLDEFTKGAEPVKNMLHPLLETSNPRLGDLPVHPESLIFLTGNLTTDGVGDALKAHTRNRITPVRVRKPSSEEWLLWAVNAGIDPVICAWVNQFPHALASYLDGNQNENPYIFNPRTQQAAFVSPRSLERASYIVGARRNYDEETLTAGLIGTIGEAAARDMEAYIAYQDQLPTWDSIVNAPMRTPVPKDPGACAVLVFGAITKIEKETIVPFMEYVGRMSEEWQAVFALNVAKTPSKASIAFNSRKFGDWVHQNQDLL